MTLRHLALAAALCVCSLGCAGSTRVVHRLDPDKVRLGQPRLQPIAGTGATLKIPEEFKRRSDRVWVVEQRGGLVMLLNIVHAPPPAEGLEAWLKAKVAAVQRTGQAGVTRDEAVTLGDLDGRYVEAIETVGKDRRALFLCAVEAERGVYLVSAMAPLSLHKRFGAQLSALVRSLRVR